MRMQPGPRLPRSALTAAVVIQAAALLLGPSTAWGQTAVLTGRVTDGRTTEPLGNVTVQVEGTRLAAATNTEGRYRIGGVPAGAHQVIARRLGYMSARRTVAIEGGGDVVADFALQAGAISLDQVVVTGTAGGEQIRSIGNVVSTIDAVDARDKSAAPDLSSLIRARAPGVFLNGISGRVGAGPSISIRGPASIGLSNNPLLYIDGIRVNNATAIGPTGVSGGLGTQGAAVGNRLNDINPDDIESIEIIKGPAAATIYGTEASSGVIQIITKKGQAGNRPRVSARVENGPIFFRDAEHRVWTNYDSSKTTGQIVPWNGVQAEKERGTPIFNTGQERHYDLSVSGGTGDVRYYVATGFMNDLGIEPNNSSRQLTAHGNISTSLGQSSELSTSFNFVDKSDHLGADVGASALLGAIAGHGELFTKSRGFYPGFPPDVPQQLYDNAIGTNRFTGGVTLDNHPVSWLSQRVVLGLDYDGEDRRAIEHFAPPDLATFLSTASAGGRLGQTLSHTSVITAAYGGTTKFDLGPSLSSSSSIGGQFYNTEQNSSFLGGFGFPAPGVETVSAAANAVASSQTQVINTTIGAYAQQMFGWHERLFLTGGVRVDNNSAFGKDFKWVTYPKVSASWVISEEPFWRWHRLNSVRLRAAYGESGRQPNAFSALRTYTPTPGVSGVTPGAIGNPDLRPERGKEWEGGFEIAASERLSFDFTYFNKKTLDEIVSQSAAPSSGFPGSQFVNLGRVDSHGYEAVATIRPLQWRNVAWDVTANVSMADNVIRSNIVNAVASAGTANIIGYPINALWARRVVSADRGPDGKATNILCDGAGNPPVACATAPFVYIGSSTPKGSGSMGNTVTVGKHWRFYGLLDYKTGYRIYNQNELIRCAGLAGAPLCEANWYPQKYSPIYLAETVTSAASLSTVDSYMQDASFLKLRELSVAYQLPQRILPGTSSASLSFAARELHTWTKYNGLDPEAIVASGAVEQAVTPPLTRYIVSLSVSW